MNFPTRFFLSVVGLVVMMVLELLAAAGYALAQQNTILDSLHRAVEYAPNDTARIAALCRLSYRFVVTEYNDSLGRLKANEAFRLAERLTAINDESYASYYRALALQTLGTTYRFAVEMKRPLAEPYFQAAMEEARRIPNARRSLLMQASVLHERFTGLRFRIRSHYKSDKPLAELRSEAARLLQAQRVIADQLNDNSLRGRILLNQAIVLTDSGARRLLLAMEAARLYEQAADGDHAGLAYTLQYVGFFADRIGDYPYAMQAYKRAVHLLDSMGAQRGLSVCYSAMGDIYAKLSDTAKALESYRRAEPYSEQFDVKFNRIELLQKMGVLYQRRGSYDNARTYFARATVLNKEMNRQIYDIIRAGQLYRQQDSLRASLEELMRALQWAKNLTVQTPLYQVLYELALTHQQQALRNTIASSSASLDSALFFGKQSLQVMFDANTEVATAERFVSTYTLLYELSKKAGDIRSALSYHEELHRWEDSTVSNEKYRVIAAMDSRAVVEAIEAKVETLEAKDHLQRAVSIMIGIATLALAAIAGLLAWRYNERKRATALLQAQNDQLTALNTEKNEFLGIAAHDLKNPLSAILSSAEILKRYYENDEETRDFVTLIIDTSERMLDIIKNLLDVNRIESGSMTMNIHPISLNVVEAVVADYQQRARQKNITMHYQSARDGTLPMVLVDKQAFMQVVDNLMSNAIKYSPQGKNVWVRILSRKDDNGKTVGRLEVQDEGQGISEEDMKKLFGKFVRLTARPTGGEHSTGLGLSIVKKMVEAMNGRVWCESELGHGATFIVELPQYFT